VAKLVLVLEKVSPVHTDMAGGRSVSIEEDSKGHE
jgi:hypothetical protein